MVALEAAQMSASGRKQKLENSEPCGVEQLAKDIFLETNMSAIAEREQALSILKANSQALSRLYRECILSKGKGALLIYAEDIIEGRIPAKGDYRSREEMLEIFDKPKSHDRLAEMIDNYEPNKEGIMTLITS